jgi:hypothetical protein
MELTTISLRRTRALGMSGKATLLSTEGDTRLDSE